MNQIEEKQTTNGQRLMCKLAADPSSAQFDDVVGQRARQISAGSNISDDL